MPPRLLRSRRFVVNAPPSPPGRFRDRSNHPLRSVVIGGLTVMLAVALLAVGILVALARPASAATYTTTTGSLFGGCRVQTTWVTGYGSPYPNQGARAISVAITPNCRRVSSQLTYRNGTVSGSTPLIQSGTPVAVGKGAIVQLWNTRQVLVTIRLWVATMDGRVLFKECNAVARTCTERYV